MTQMLIFDIEGNIAHFRKFYTNSSSLSYSFPPKTVIAGLIAGVLGFERDSYYKVFNTELCKIGLSIRKPIRKLIQTVNYIRTKNNTEITGAGGHTQIPVEFVVPVEEVLLYRVYFCHSDEDTLKNLGTKLQNGNYIYPPYLGITECPAITHLIDDNPQVIFYNEFTENTSLSTVVPIEKVENIQFKEGYKYMKEDKVPLEFNLDRKILKVSSYIYEKNCKTIDDIKVKGEVFKVIYNERQLQIEEFGVFM